MREFTATPLILLISWIGMGCAAAPAQTGTPAADHSTQLMRVLQEPMPPDEDISGRDALAKRQARAAAELVKLGRAEMVWPLLQQSRDNSRRTYLIRELGTVAPAILIRRLEAEKDVSIRRALILS